MSFLNITRSRCIPGALFCCIKLNRIDIFSFYFRFFEIVCV